jgi:prepilin-type N-terminal cleavage/methylation domain-containing protein
MNPAFHRVEDDARQPGRGAFFRGWAGLRGFTLLEMCIVLLILAVLMGVIAPGMQSALAEAGLRSDARELSLMVKTAMLQSVEEHRVYALNLSEKTMALGPIAPAAPEDANAPADPNQPLELAQDSIENWKLDTKNKLLLPDPEGHGRWQPIESAQWVFRPGELCPARQICFTRGEARLEVTFNALTGNVEDERSIFP